MAKPRQRHTPAGRRPAWIPTFLAAYGAGGVVSYAAAAARINRTTVYARMKSDPEFAADFEAAEADATDALVAEARRRALEEGSDRLLEFLIRAHRPEKYGDRAKVELTGANGGPIRRSSEVWETEQERDMLKAAIRRELELRGLPVPD